MAASRSSQRVAARPGATVRRLWTSAPSAGAGDAPVRGAGPGSVNASSPARVRASGRSPRCSAARLLAAAVRVLEEQGYEHATVAHITHRARVSRRTFYELFANREQCIAAVLRRHRRAHRAGAAPRPAWSRVAVARADARWPVGDPVFSGARARARRGCWSCTRCVAAARCSGRASRSSTGWSRVSMRAAARARAAAGRSELTAGGVVGAAFAILYGRLARSVRPVRPRLTRLLGELTGTVVLPYLGPAAARSASRRGRRRRRHAQRARRCAARGAAGSIRWRVCRCV